MKKHNETIFLPSFLTNINLSKQMLTYRWPLPNLKTALFSKAELRICTWLLVWSQLCTIFVVVCCPTGYKILFLLHYLLMSLAVSPRKLSLWPKSVEVSTLFEPLSLNIVECVLLLNIFQFLFNILSHQAKAIAQKCIFSRAFSQFTNLAANWSCPTQMANVLELNSF